MLLCAIHAHHLLPGLCAFSTVTFMAGMTTKILILTVQRDDAARRYFDHLRRGNLTPSQLTAFELQDVALRLLLKAAQIELDAEIELQTLLNVEQAA